MNSLINILAKSGLVAEDLDYHVVRASMVLIFLLFGYQKWFAYEAQALIPYISNGPLIAWLLALSVYLLRQDVVRVLRSAGDMTNPSTIRRSEMAGPPHKEDGVRGRVQRRADTSDLERNTSGTDQE
jgi:uncharacterized membrane protein YkgB